MWSAYALGVCMHMSPHISLDMCTLILWKYFGNIYWAFSTIEEGCTYVKPGYMVLAYAFLLCLPSRAVYSHAFILSCLDVYWDTLPLEKPILSLQHIDLSFLPPSYFQMKLIFLKPIYCFYRFYLFNL